MNIMETLMMSPYFGLFLTFFFFIVGAKLHKRFKMAIFTPLIFAIICIMLILFIFDIPYEVYFEGGQYVNIWITPATVALAVKLERNFKYLRENYISILLGITAGVIFHTAIVLGLSLLFRLDGVMFATLYPKSITSAIALGVSESLGGIVSLTVAIVVFTGVLGTVVAPYVFKFSRIDDPVAQGISLGAGAHAMGTTKAIELGEVQGAMSGLSIVVTGLVVVALVPLVELMLAILF